jgi:hypothetical protein
MLVTPTTFDYGVDLDTRYWPYVDITPDHWWWLRPPRVNGYGAITVDGKRTGVHRFAWMMYHGPIPEGMQIDHRCKVHACVNPDHLRLATNKQNCENSAPERGESGYRGVYRKPSGRWFARVHHNGRHHYGGTYDTPEEADLAARALRDRLYTHHTDGLDLSR